MNSLKKIFIAILLLLVVTNSYAQKSINESPASNLLTEYLSLKNALVTDNNKLAQTAAVSLSKTISLVSSTQFSSELQQVWSKYQPELLASSLTISNAQDLKNQRASFATLSSALYPVLKSLKINTVTLYQQYCPMKKVTWLSEGKEIKNPYFGRQMLSCGSNQDTLISLTK